MYMRSNIAPPVLSLKQALSYIQTLFGDKNIYFYNTN